VFWSNGAEFAIYSVRNKSNGASYSRYSCSSHCSGLLSDSRDAERSLCPNATTTDDYSVDLTEDDILPGKDMRHASGASRSGFGWNIDLGREVYYEYREWSESIQEESSNYHELRNLVNTLSKAGEDGKLD
jgi:hypothetical protein